MVSGRKSPWDTYAKELWIHFKNSIALHVHGIRWWRVQIAVPTMTRSSLTVPVGWRRERRPERIDTRARGRRHPRARRQQRKTFPFRHSARALTTAPQVRRETGIAVRVVEAMQCVVVVVFKARAENRMARAHEHSASKTFIIGAERGPQSRYRRAAPVANRSQRGQAIIVANDWKHP